MQTRVRKPSTTTADLRAETRMETSFQSPQVQAAGASCIPYYLCSSLAGLGMQSETGSSAARPNPSTRTSPRVKSFFGFSTASPWSGGVPLQRLDPGAVGFRCCGATENRLHIYKRSFCTCRCGPRYEPLSRAPFAPRGWARSPSRRVSRVRRLPV